eukprot:8659535-Alexandrium_andersonii.AAC.1
MLQAPERSPPIARAGVLFYTVSNALGPMPPVASDSPPGGRLGSLDTMVPKSLAPDKPAEEGTA